MDIKTCIGHPTMVEIRVYGNELRELIASVTPGAMRWSDKTLLADIEARFALAIEHEENIGVHIQNHGSSYISYLLGNRVDQKLWNFIVEKESIPGFQNHQYALVVRAQTEEHARKIAYAQMVSQGHGRVRFAERWLDPKQVRCVELVVAGPPGVVVYDGLMIGERG